MTAWGNEGFGDARLFLRELFEAAVKAADPLAGIKAHLPAKPKGRTVVIGAGKGAAQMARALESVWDGPLSGVVVTRYGYGCATQYVDIIEAAHPVPDAAGLTASQRLFEAITDLGPEDLVIALICGGGSALLPAPPASMSLEDEISVNRVLLSSGAPISAMNIVRKHLSRIKGGRLAAATRARVVSLIVSDIPGDNPAYVASGPTVPDASTRHDALDVVRQYRLNLPEAAVRHLQSSAADAPRPDDPLYQQHQHFIIASSARSLEAASDVARGRGIAPVILSDSIEGESRDVALVHAAIAREIAEKNRPFAKPVVLLSGGETTVTIKHGCGGKGGRNSEFALSAALALQGLTVVGLAADTDGIDGSEDNAGAYFDGNVVRELRALGYDPQEMLAGHDSHRAFSSVNSLFMTGPTGTNVNDFRAILII
ncbi:glycerate kinase type-2 family protein [Oryzifoliimicrobium ureilyticus]|uniref:glycerate kinase type-2 family protein n=1 Tax=Oryzifoliimicrobium ureilyticus TaxID=3113724 RepID=UPI0030767777